MNAIARPLSARDVHEARIRTDLGVAQLIAFARGTETEAIAHGSRGTVKRRRRVDQLLLLRFDEDKLRDQSMRHAAIRYRQAHEHMEAGRGLGPMPWGKDEQSAGGAGPMPAQIRALTAAMCYRVGVQALGVVASQGVVQWAVIAGLPLSEFDAVQGRRKGTAKADLATALVRLAVAYGYEMPTDVVPA